MPVSVKCETVRPRKLAAVRREVAPGEVDSAWGPAIGKVWPFIRSQPDLWTEGHNIFLYHHPTQPGSQILCDFAVEVTDTFAAGAFYVMDRGYIDFERLHAFTLSSAFFVVRTKENIPAAG
jgi:hypothetical protein